MSLQPVSLQPVSLQPVFRQPATTQPATTQPVSFSLARPMFRAQRAIFAFRMFVLVVALLELVSLR